MSSELYCLAVYLPKSDQHRIRVSAAQKDLTVKEFVKQALDVAIAAQALHNDERRQS